MLDATQLDRFTGIPYCPRHMDCADLALLVLDSPSEIAPIKLPAEGQEVEPGTPVWNAGYRWVPA